MKHFKTITITAICTLYITTSVIAEIEESDNHKVNDIRRLMVLIDSSKFALQMISKVIIKYRNSFPQVEEDTWQEFIDNIDPNEMIELLIPIYDKHFTHSEIKQLILFYESPVGKKVTYSLPNITVESLVVGIQWVKKISQEIDQKLQSQGYLYEPMTDDPL